MTPLKVAVIGAGVSGLCTARELQREGLHVVVYEKSDKIGGTWVYNPKVEADPLGLDPNRKIVHSSLYSSLHTNLPRALMGFSDYPFPVAKNGEPRTFPGHEEVLRFLNDFANEFELPELVRFNTEVLRVEQVSPKDDKWVVESRNVGNELSSEEIFEAVVVCNGHNTHPRVAEIAGVEKWPGKQIHCHNYRNSAPFRDQVVVVIGHGPSAMEIAVEVALVAKEVHLSSRFPGIPTGKLETHSNLWQHSEIDYCNENGEVAFREGTSVAVDIILHCTGYNYNFPFLKTNGIVTIEDNRIDPLYKHVFPPQFAPRLAFVGVPKQTMNFMMMDLQAKWVAHVLSGKAPLPSEEEMLASVKEHYQLMEKYGIPQRHTHTLPIDRFDYMDWLCSQVGLPPLDEKKKEIFLFLFKVVFTSWTKYRVLVDEWIHENGY